MLIRIIIYCVRWGRKYVRLYPLGARVWRRGLEADRRRKKVEPRRMLSRDKLKGTDDNEENMARTKLHLMGMLQKVKRQRVST